jgi:hypothetical protein
MQDAGRGARYLTDGADAGLARANAGRNRGLWLRQSARAIGGGLDPAVDAVREVAGPANYALNLSARAVDRLIQPARGGARRKLTLLR